MEEIAISKFKATCLAVLDKVRLTGKPVCVTRRGQVIAQINPPVQPADGLRKLGWLQGELHIADEDLINFSAWDTEAETVWQKKWDERLGPQQPISQTPPAKKRPKR
jgi:antitoxin (DNA-binding transcriptional repressor) of toxin-antitoxin stability system